MSNKLASRLKPTSNAPATPAPVFYNLSHSTDQAKLEQLITDNPHLTIIDTYNQQLLELFVLDNPSVHTNPPARDKQFKPFRDEHYGRGEAWQAGQWVYLRWCHTVLHILDDAGYQQVRTGRNRNLITAAEQVKYYNSTIGIGGLSVGNSIALSIVLTGGGKHMKLADPDTLELTNLNRIRASVSELTEPKVYMTARQIYELDPYADLTLYTAGITPDNIDEYFDGLDVMIDEIDNLPIKINLRKHAKQHKIPILMATDNGDSGVLDIERHDLDDNIPYFHGRAGDDIEEVVAGDLPLPLIGKLIGEKLIGFDITEPRMQQSLLAIGHTIPTWPQLGGAALLNGVAVAAATRKILTDQPVADNRAVLSLSSWLIPGYDEPPQVEQRAADTQQFADKYNQAIANYLKKSGPRDNK